MLRFILGLMAMAAGGAPAGRGACLRFRRRLPRPSRRSHLTSRSFRSKI